MAKALTALAIEHLKPDPTRRREIRDGKVGGLYLVLQTSGAKSWALRYRAAGKPTKLTLGGFPALDLAAARRLAQEKVGEVAKGRDPAGQKRDDKAARKKEEAAKDGLVESVVADFIKFYARRFTRDWRETERLLRKDLLGAWSGRRLADIARKDVIKLLDEIVARKAPVGANRTLAQIRKLCSWAVQRGIIDRSPCDGVAQPSPETPRERVLSDEELRLVFLGSGELPSPYSSIVRLLALTGARRGEVAGLAWDELDLDAAVWNLPAARSKNGRSHTVPLSPMALGILQGLPRFSGAGLVFTAGKSTPHQFSTAKNRLDAAVARLNGGAPIRPYVLHDLRRSFVSGLARLGVDLHVIERAVNHLSGSFGGIVQVYQRHKYEDAVRRAMNAWAAHIEGLVTGNAAPTTNVFELSAARS